MEEGTNVITKQETTDVIGLDGKSDNRAASPLAGMFDKIEAGKAEGKSAKEVVQEVKVEPQQRPRDETTGKFKPVEKQEEKKEEKKEKSELEKKLDDTQQKKDDKTDEDDPRAALRRATEEKKVEKKEEKKEEKAEEKKEDDVPEDELQVLPHDKPKTAKRIQKLLDQKKALDEVVTKTRAEANEKAQKLAELEKKLSEVKTVDPTTDEKIKKQLDELAMFRRRYELDNDPEVKTKFDARVESAEQSIAATLKKRGAGEGLLNLIKEEGGWAGFAGSNRIVTIPDGEGGQKQVTAAELADAVLQQLPLAERKGVEAAMVEQVQTKRDRERFFKEQQDTAVQYFKKKDEENQKQSAEQQKQVAEAKQTIENWRKSVEAQEWLKDKEVPANATPEQKAAILENNKYNGQLRAYISKAINTQDLPGVLAIFEDAARYYDERRNVASMKRENEKLKAELEAKQAELTKFKTAGRSVPRGGSISVAATKESEGAPKKEMTLEERFSAMERGELPRKGDSDE